MQIILILTGLAITVILGLAATKPETFRVVTRNYHGTIREDFFRD